MYYQSSFLDRHPVLRMIITSGLVGIALSVFLAGLIAMCMWASDAPLEAVWDTSSVMVVLLLTTLPPGLAACMLTVYLRRLMPGVLPQNEVQEPAPVSGYVPNAQTLAEQVRESAVRQAEWHYRLLKEPTRDKMCTLGWMTQPLWNSGRQVLTAMGLVDGRTWVTMTWERVSRLVSRIAADGDRLWYPSNGNSQASLTIVAEGDNNSYIVADPPTPPADLGQFRQKTPSFG